MSVVDVVIPTKSNFGDLERLIGQLSMDASVGLIVIVCDGPNALKHVSRLIQDKVVIFAVPVGTGIHNMWNIGMDYLQKRNNHIAFINDDVSISENCVSLVAGLIDSDPTLGLVSPCVDNSTTEPFIPSTGFAGFCMFLVRDLVSKWRFDERMRWWYGDVDVICWVSQAENRRTGVTGVASCSGNRSQTIVNDPPPNFQRDIENDARLFAEKWPAAKQL